jgi:DNA-binding MarR family transcriptional regulator
MSPSPATEPPATEPPAEAPPATEPPAEAPPATGPPAKAAAPPGSGSPVPKGPLASSAQWTTELTDLGKAFRRVFRTLSRLRGRDTHLGGAELSHAQFELLIELHERGEMPAGELALAARLAPGTVTQMLDHLAESGHVERVRSESDRRVVVCRLTAQGRRKIEAKREAWQSRWEHALDGVESDELRAATRVLERLGAAFEDAPPADACATVEQGERARPDDPA